MQVQVHLTVTTYIVYFKISQGYMGRHAKCQ